MGNQPQDARNTGDNKSGGSVGTVTRASAAAQTARTSVPPAASGKTGHGVRVAMTGMIGTLIEFYDFMIYGLAAAIVFGDLFFPNVVGVWQTLASFATFGVAFIARPVGGILFGHFGDRLGRKKTLIVSLLGMGIATVGIGLLPTADQIGVLAPILLVVLRFVQGLAAGGEWAGATLFVAEHSPTGKRGLWAMFPQLGATSANVVGYGVFFFVGLTVSDTDFANFAWRIPFLASIILVAFGLWARMLIEETPAFEEQKSQAEISKIPLIDAFRGEWKTILIASGVGLGTNCYFFVCNTFLTNFAIEELGLSRSWVLFAGLIGGITLTISAVTSAIQSDRFGRRNLIIAGSVLGAIWALALVPVIEIRTPLAYIIAVSVCMIWSGMVFGPMGAFLPELFRTKTRFTATAVSYNMCTILGGTVAPLLATALTAQFGISALGILLAVLCALGALCTFSLRETSVTSINPGGNESASV